MAEYAILIVFHAQNKHKFNDDNTSYHRSDATRPSEFQLSEELSEANLLDIRK
jgi:hypothetical protein